MENLNTTQPVEVEQITDKERISLLGALGLVDALMFDLPEQTEHVDSVWKSIN